MQVKFKRTGGFANIGVDVSLDTNNLDEGAASQLQNLVKKVLPFNNAQGNPGADMHSYDLEVEDGGEVHKLQCTDADLTDDLQNLFDFVLDNS